MRFCAGMHGVITGRMTARRGLLRRAYRPETAAERPLALIFRRGELAGLRNRGCSRCRCSTTRWSIETGANFTSLYSLRSIQNRKGSLPGDILGSEEEKGRFLALIFRLLLAVTLAALADVAMQIAPWRRASVWCLVNRRIGSNGSSLCVDGRTLGAAIMCERTIRPADKLCKTKNLVL